MSRIVLVRHGQASFWAAEYDQLSPLGIEQSRLLGEHWGASTMERVRADVPRGEVAVVFTSGGVISAAVGGMLRAADLETFALSARIANASTTEFVTTPTRMSLASFNLVSHVPDHLVTLI